jgi:hypothetical protein
MGGRFSDAAEFDIKPRMATVLKFVSRAEHQRLRGQRKYSRYMRINKRFVDLDGPERTQWQRESAQESFRDDEWNRRHGPVSGGVTILKWHRGERQLDQPASLPRSTAAGETIR